MASPNTLKLRNMSFGSFMDVKDRPARERDRSLAGKKRIKARRATR